MIEHEEGVEENESYNPQKLAEFFKDFLTPKSFAEIAAMTDMDEALVLAATALKEEADVEDAYGEIKRFLTSIGLLVDQTHEDIPQVDTSDTREAVAEALGEVDNERAFREKSAEALKDILDEETLKKIREANFFWATEPTPPQEWLIYRILVKWWLKGKSDAKVSQKIKDPVAFLKERGIENPNPELPLD